MTCSPGVCEVKVQRPSLLYTWKEGKQWSEWLAIRHVFLRRSQYHNTTVHPMLCIICKYGARQVRHMQEPRADRPSVQDIYRARCEYLNAKKTRSSAAHMRNSFATLNRWYHYKLLAGSQKARLFRCVNWIEMEVLIIVSLGIIVLIILLGGWRDRFGFGRRTNRDSSKRKEGSMKSCGDVKWEICALCMSIFT